MAKIDKISVEVLADGTIKIVSDAISPANHTNAENLHKNIAVLAGGEVSRTKRTDVQQHGHGHTHGHQTHSH